MKEVKTKEMVARDQALRELFGTVIMGTPQEFSLGERRFYLWPLTLAKTFLLRPYLIELGLSDALGNRPTYPVVLQLVKVKRETCARILAIHSTPNTRASFVDTRQQDEVCGIFLREMKDSDMAALLLIVLTCDVTEQLSEWLGLSHERGRMEEALSVKRGHDRNNLSFGGKTVLGGFICPLKEMGYSDEEILFERGYSYLRLMLLDKAESVYLSDDELEEVRGSAGAMIDGESAGADRQLSAFFASRGIKVKSEE